MKARPHFAGIDLPYEAPEAAELHLLATQQEPAAMAERVVQALGLG